MRPAPTPRLAFDLAGALEGIAALPEAVDLEDIPAVLGKLAETDARLRARLLRAPPPEPPDRLLTAEEAAGVMGVDADYLYRHSRKLPFTVRPTPGTLRFSERGLWRYLQARTGAR